MHLILCLLLACCGLAAGEGAYPDAAKPLPAADSDYLKGLPLLPKPQPRPVADSDPGEQIVPGILRVLGKKVVLTGEVQVDKGPVDGLEVLACLRDGKTHEALIRLDAGMGQLVKAVMIQTLGLADGMGSDEQSGLPARGTPVRVELHWKDEAGTWVGVDASCLVRDRVVDRPYPALPYIYTGSRFVTIYSTGDDGLPMKREQFTLDATRSLAVNFDEPDALLASPFPGAANDTRFEVHSGIAPPPRAQVRLVISPATLPLMLELDAQGGLTRQGVSLDDPALAAALGAVYGPEQQPDLRAVGVRVARSLDRGRDVLARARIAAAAAAAKAWVVPVFVLE